MLEQILTNEVKQDEALPIIPKSVAESAELFLHPVSSGFQKFSSGTELVFEQRSSPVNVTPSGGLRFYNVPSAITDYRIYQDINNLKLIVTSTNSREIDIIVDNGGSGVDANQTAVIFLTTSVDINGIASGVNYSLGKFNAIIDDGNTALSVGRNVAGSFTRQIVSMGVADSGGTGFKLLRVPN